MKLYIYKNMEIKHIKKKQNIKEGKKTKKNCHYYQ
jgi:hypothetical protein